MKINQKRIHAGVALAIVLLSFTAANASVSFSLGTDNFYLSVGDYDYLPYAYETVPGYVPPRVSFYNVMSDYGVWVTVSTFRQCWQPYASFGWRPYSFGHWIYTQYGPMWEGYEPWAWVGYHYGSWIFTRNFGWVWVPGYDWHPGRVAWARGYDTIGWMPLPPDGYDYSNGDLQYSGPNNQFTYQDNDFGDDGGAGMSATVARTNDSRYRPMYYKPRLLDRKHQPLGVHQQFQFWIDNYADNTLGP